MSDQTQYSQLGHEKEKGELLPGLDIEIGLNPEQMKESIEGTLIAFAHQIENDLENFPGVDIIIPFDGGLVAMNEFKKLSPSVTARVNFIYAAKNPNELGAYLISKPVRAGTRRYILDDIYDAGHSSKAIRTAAGAEDITVVVLSSKEGKSYNQPNIPLYIYRKNTRAEDKWVASGFGMNDGKFGSYALIKAVAKGLIPSYGEELLLVHEEIEIFQRICGVSFILDNEDLLNLWRFDIAKCYKFLDALKRNCMYRDYDDKVSVINTLRLLQRAVGEDKFVAMQAAA